MQAGVHPDETKIVYRKDFNRGDFSEFQFDFLRQFRVRKIMLVEAKRGASDKAHGLAAPSSQQRPAAVIPVLD